MKRENILFQILFLFTIFTLGWVTTGCREDVVGASGITRRVRLSVNVTDDGGNLTRATLAEEEGSLKSDWDSGDKLIVANSEGKKLGELTLKSPANKETDSEGGTVYRFEGDITTEDSGTATYSFFHIANKDIANLTNDNGVVTIDYSNQDGSTEWIRSHDIFSGQAKVVFTTAPSTDDESGESTESAQSETVKLSRPIAFGHFTLSFPEGVTVANDVMVKITGKGIYTTLNVSLGENSYSVGNGESGENGAEGSVESGIITTKGSDLYLAILVPKGGEIEPVFTATIDGVEYTGTLGEHKWEAGTFVREGHKEGVSVKMEGESDEEDPDNPLTKFAKTNLIRLSARGDSNIENGFAESETHPGALFQWGRNYGFMPVTSKTFAEGTVPENFKHVVGTTFSHWLDAFGPLPPDATVTEYLVIHEYDQNQYYRIYSGGSYIKDSKLTKVEVSIITSTYHNVTEYDNKVFMMKDFNFQESAGVTEMWDYWSFNNIGDKWTDRSSVMYPKLANPCPEGWHIPTSDDFASILPSTTPEDNESFDNLLLSIQSELKESNGKYYAFRWIKHTHGIEIQSVKVNEGTDPTTINWEREKGVVKRVFPFTGRIECLNFNNINGMRYSLPFYPHTAHPDPNSDTFGSDILDISNTENIGQYLGGYWIDQGNRTFIFSTEKGPGGKMNINGLSDSKPKSTLKVCDNQRPWAYAIRPVKDQEKKEN